MSVVTAVGQAADHVDDASDLVNLSPGEIDQAVRERFSWTPGGPPVCLSPLWFRWARTSTVLRLHHHLESHPEGGAVDDDNLERACAAAVRLVSVTAALLFTYREANLATVWNRGMRTGRRTSAEEDALVALCEESEFVGLTLLAAVLNEMEFATRDRRPLLPPSFPSATPERHLGRHRWPYLADFRRPGLDWHCKYRLDETLRMTEPARPVSYAARYNLACLFSRRAQLLNANPHHYRYVPTRAHTTGTPGGVPATVDGLDYDPRLLSDPELLLDHGRSHYNLALDSIDVQATATGDPSLAYLLAERPEPTAAGTR